MSNLFQHAKEKLSQVVLAKTGILTSDLVRSPGKFGLGQVPEKIDPDRTTTSVCGFCSTGCGLDIHLKDGQAVNLSPATDWPVNLGMACPKGWESLEVLKADDRATKPLLRNEQGQKVAIDWQTAAGTFATRFQAIQRQHGPESVAFLSTGQIATEEMFFLGALAKFGMGMLHGDGNTRQCMATAVVAYKEAFGFDAPPYTYADFEQSDVIVLVGSNLCIAHPIMWQRVLQNPHNPRIVVIDPRRTETAQAATDHLPIRPKSDLTLLYTLANLLIQRGWIDQEFIDRHTNDFTNFRDHVASYTLEAAETACGIPASQIESLASLIHQGQRVSFWWTMGVNQSHQGVRTAQAIINLALMTGNIGRPGTGANSITGQCNAMGSRLFSNTTNLLGGHNFANEADREKIADILEIPVERIPNQASWSYDQIMEGIRAERIKGLWVIATNPAHSWIDQHEAHQTLEKLDFLVVQDMYHSTETAQVADLLLPAAGWGEKEGTFINSERRIGLHKKVTKAPGQAMADFQIFRLLADAWGCGDWSQDWTTPEQVFQTMKRCSVGQPCDITGIIDYAMLDDQRGIQWPYTAEDATPPSRERRLFEDGTFFHTEGKARFVFEPSHSSPDAISTQFPFRLLTGRGTAAQWHTQTKTAKSATLRKLYPSTLLVQMHPDDAASLEIGDHDPVTISSPRGTIQARAQLSRNVGRTNLFLPMHDPRVNQLTVARFDPYSRQPSYKDTPVSVVKQASSRSINGDVDGQ